MKRRRVFLLGLDGATWSLLNVFLGRGLMPNLKDLVEKYSAGKLNSTIPPITPVAWTSLQTGVNPGKHGISEFVQFLWKKEPLLTLVNRTHIRVKTLWEILSDLKRKVALAFLPMTYPPFRVNGALITGLMTPGKNVIYSFPGNLTDQLRKEGIYPLLGREITKFHLSKSLREYRRNLHLMVESVERDFEAVRLMDSTYPDWDVFFLQIQSMDVVQHFLWGYICPGHPMYDEETCNYVGEEYYAKVDEVLGMIFDLYVDGSTLFILVSDHGFRGYEKVVNFGNLMVQLGFTHLKSPPLSNRAAREAIKFLKRVDVFRFRRRLVKDQRRQRIRQGIESMSMKDQIDWEESTAVCIGRGTNCYAPLYIGPKVQKDSSFIKRLKEALLEYALPSTDGEERIVQQILEKDSIYSGPNTELMPDFIVLPMSTTAFRMGMKQGTRVAETLEENCGETGIHDPSGIFVVAGGEAASRKGLEYSILDIPATVLWYLGLPIPSEYDGAPMLKAFRDDFVARKALKRQDISIYRDSRVEQLSDDELRELEDKLRGIGYIG